MKHFLFFIFLASSIYAQDAPQSSVNLTSFEFQDSPISFPEKGALPSLFEPDLNVVSFPVEKDYFLFRSPCRSIGQINEIRMKMPAGEMSISKTDWRGLSILKQKLKSNGQVRILGLGDSIINDIMRSGWLSKLQEQFPSPEIIGTVYVRGGGGCQHYKEGDRIEKYLVSQQPDLVIIGGISQADMASIKTVVGKIRESLPDCEFLFLTGVFGKTDARNDEILSKTRYSGTSTYGLHLKQLAQELDCAFLEMTSPWSQYIKSSNIHPHYFYRDKVHANEYGEQILSQILNSYFSE